MKLFVKLMLAGLVLAFLLPFTLLKDDQGKTLMSFSDFSLGDFNLPGFSLADFNLPDILGDDRLLSTDGGGSREDIFYRWNDAKGNVHFTTEPPPDGIEFSVKGYNPDANVIQAVKLPDEPVAEPPATVAEPASADKSSAQDIDNPYNKNNVQKLFDDSNNIEQLLNQRLNNQNSVINQ
jgi:hypothetical protein